MVVSAKNGVAIEVNAVDVGSDDRGRKRYPESQGAILDGQRQKMRNQRGADAFVQAPERKDRHHALRFDRGWTRDSLAVVRWVRPEAVCDADSPGLSGTTLNARSARSRTIRLRCQLTTANAAPEKASASADSHFASASNNMSTPPASAVTPMYPIWSHRLLAMTARSALFCNSGIGWDFIFGSGFDPSRPKRRGLHRPG